MLEVDELEASTTIEVGSGRQKSSKKPLITITRKLADFSFDRLIKFHQSYFELNGLLESNEGHSCHVRIG